MLRFFLFRDKKIILFLNTQPAFMLVCNFSPFPVLQNDRILLREILDEDVDAMFVLRSDNEAMKYIDRPRAKTIADAQEQVNKIKTGLITNDSIAWAITLKGHDEMIGNIGYWNMDKANYRSELGYMLQPKQHRKGIMNEAIGLVIDYGFKKLKLHSICANVNPANEASKKILEKNGFVKEAYFRENYFYDGRFLDSLIYSLLTPLR